MYILFILLSIGVLSNFICYFLFCYIFIGVKLGFIRNCHSTSSKVVVWNASYGLSTLCPPQTPLFRITMYVVVVFVVLNPYSMMVNRLSPCVLICW